MAFGNVVVAHWRKILVTVVALNVIAAGVTFAVFLRNRSKPKTPEITSVPVTIRVVPESAVVQVDGAVRDASQEIVLPLGSHRVYASLDGYEPAETSFEVRATGVQPIELRLSPLTMSVQLYSRLRGATVLFDGQKIEPSGDDWFVIPDVSDGAHTIETRYGAVLAKIDFEAAPGRAPTLTGPMTTKNCLVLAVSHAPGASARFVSSGGPAQLTLTHGEFAPVDIGPVGPTAPATAELTADEWQIALREGGRADTPYPLRVGKAPFLALFLRTDLGQLDVQFSPRDAVARLERNGKPMPSWSPRNQPRAYFANLEPAEYILRVERDGFEPQSKRIVIAAGSHLREKIDLVERPRKGALEITGLPEGYDVTVSLDGKQIGAVSSGGSFRYTEADPGRHTIRLAVRVHDSEPITAQFNAGETVRLNFNDFKPQKRYGALDFDVRPPSAIITLTDDRGQSRSTRLSELVTPELPLDFGREYAVTIEAPGHKPFSRRRIAVRDTPRERVFHLGTIALEPIAKTAPPPKAVTVLTPPGWDDPTYWAPEADGWKRYQRGRTVVVDAPLGTITFEIRFRGDVEWQINYVDNRNYVNVELKKERLIRRRRSNGRNESERKIDIRGAQQEMRKVRIVQRDGHIIHSIWDGANWVDLDDLDGNELGKGKFVLSVNNRVYLKDFEYVR